MDNMLHVSFSNSAIDKNDICITVKAGNMSNLIWQL